MNKKLKVLFITYPMAFHTPGGGEIQLLAYKKHLEQLGVEVDLFDPWNPNFLEYDLVHYFSVIGGSVHICNFIKGLGLPLVVSSSLWITEESKHLYPIQEIKHQLSLADVVIGNSDIECDNMAEVFNLPRDRFKTVYNGVEDIFFEKVEETLFRKHFDISDDFVLNVGNIEPRKNQLNLAKAMKGIPDKKLVLIGHIRDTDYAKEVFEEGGLQIMHLDYLENSDELLRSAFSACEVFCLPSTLETPGLAALEALANGSKVVVTKEGATHEYFKDAVYYCDPLSIQNITEKIELAMGEQITNKNSIEDYKWHNVVNRLIETYTKMKDKE